MMFFPVITFSGGQEEENRSWGPEKRHVPSSVPSAVCWRSARSSDVGRFETVFREVGRSGLRSNRGQARKSRI